MSELGRVRVHLVGGVAAHQVAERLESRPDLEVICHRTLEEAAAVIDLTQAVVLVVDVDSLEQWPGAIMEKVAPLSPHLPVVLVMSAPYDLEVAARHGPNMIAVQRDLLAGGGLPDLLRGEVARRRLRIGRPATDER
ncbi:hypothetical protein [Marinimicrococcus flavescens]|uniref:Uncharacterized protein n=1 Tax=Marinimicrococcus flavescens TaxID=3031815 RepID=A0AAP4D4P0_9PROT|nr:hypothetical protein [Marinimicrococcus flavescens]